MYCYYLRNIFILLETVEIKTDDTTDMLKISKNGNDGGANESGGGSESKLIDAKQCDNLVDAPDAPFDDDDGNANHAKCDESKPVDPNDCLADSADAANAADNRNARRIVIGVPGSAQDTLGSRGRSVIMDPFRRGEHVPFNIYGRRRSISVFPTVREE